MTNIYTPYSPPGQTAQSLANALILTTTGISIVGGSASYIGDPTASSFFDSIHIGDAVLQSGILLTSGDGTPGTTNTLSSYSDANGQAGDTDLDDVIDFAFSGAGASQDATILTFQVDVTDPSIVSLSFDLMFGSDEYPEYSSSSFVDIAAVFVNGTNAAFFGGSALRPLSVLDQNLSYFQNNQDGSLATEYDGISLNLTVWAPVQQGINTIKIAIADTGDQIYDSGLFVSNLQGSTVNVAGVKQTISGDDLANFLLGIGSNDEYFDCGGGNDTAFGGLGNDILDGGDGNDDLNGGRGFDIYIGGDGADDFDFNSIKDSSKKANTADLIADFQRGLDDIDVQGILGKTKFKFIGTREFSGDQPEIRYQKFNKPGTDNDYTLVYGNINSNPAADFVIKLDGLFNLKGADFIL